MFIEGGYMLTADENATNKLTLKTSDINYKCLWDIPLEVFMVELKKYDAHLDDKKRITLRGALFKYYLVKEYDNGCILLEPRELIKPKSISKRTLKAMDEAINNFNVDIVSDPIDLSKFK